MAEIGAAVAILPSAPVAVRSNDVEFIYRQDNDFYYLTGFRRTRVGGAVRAGPQGR